MAVKKIILLLWPIVFLFSSTVFAETKTVTGKHAEAKVTCAACHGSDAPTKRAPASACISCHGDNASVAKRTKNVTPNPHDSHQGDLRCTLCHKTHEPSVVYCDECHSFKFNIK